MDAHPAAAVSTAPGPPAAQPIVPALADLNEAVIVLDDEKRITAINQSAAELFGYEAHEVSGQLLDVLLPDHDEVVDWDDRDVGPAPRRQYRLVGHRPDGDEFAASTTVSPMAADSDHGWILVVRDSTTEARNLDRLRHAARIDMLLAYLCSTLSTVPPDELDAEIELALYRVGDNFHADRVLLFQLSGNGRVISSTHEWCGSGVTSHISSLKGLPCDLFPWLAAAIARREDQCFGSIDELPLDASAEKQMFQALGARSAALLPMAYGQRVVGFLCLISVHDHRVWEPGELRPLRVITDALCHAFQRRRLSRELSNNQQNLQTLLDGLVDYLFILDHAGRILHANPPVIRRLRYGLRQLRGKTIFELIPSKDRAEARSLLDRNLQPGTSFLFPLEGRDGTIVAVETRVARGSWNNQDVLFVISRDMTERKRALDGLRRFEERTSAILSAIPDAMLRLNRWGRVLDIAHGDLASGRGIGSQDELTRIAEACVPAITAALSSGQMQVVEVQLGEAEKRRTFETRVVVMSDDEALAIVRDISERARLEQMKADFINRASHELRTPLTTALLMVDLIREGGEEDELQEYWDVLRLELQRQHELVEDLLATSRLETGSMQFNMIELDVAQLLAEVVDNAARMASARGICLSTDLASELPAIAGDPSALHRVLANLLDNAMKFTPTGGQVRLEARSSGRGVQLRVVDDGIGIPEEELPQLFDRFFRASNAVRAEISGTGVGLYIVKSIVDAHSGRVSVDSAVDGGTTVTVWIPARGDTPAPDDAANDGADEHPPTDTATPSSR